MMLFLDKRIQYGQVRYFPVGPGSDSVMKLTGKKTLTSGDIRALEELEHEVFVEFENGSQVRSPYKISWANVRGDGSS